jgi:transcriptional regulator with XRE-family HTH domain
MQNYLPLHYAVYNRYLQFSQVKLIVMLTLGDKIRELRTHKGLSQENMEEILKMSATGYANIEQNKTPNVPLARIEQIAQALETNIFELMTLGEKNVAYISNSSDFVNGFIVHKNENSGTLLQKNAFLKEKITLLENQISQLHKQVDSLETLVSLLRIEKKQA